MTEEERKREREKGRKERKTDRENIVDIDFGKVKKKLLLASFPPGEEK
jgi:hypothetical protein